jgi:histidyl-tRNA synthetase
MNDILPDVSPAWNALEHIWRNVVRQYGFKEIRTPILEPTQLFCRGVGEVTDIVEKEMYSFEDRNGDWLSMRPEGTASVVRAGLQHGILHNQIQRMWYHGAMFRHERPQKGRYRQFYQFGAEVFGVATPDVDVELMALTYRFWQALGIEKDLTLELNTLGSPEVRTAYREALVSYLTPLKDQLDEDSKRRLGTNPLRILDSKNPEVQKIVADAPKLSASLDEVSRDHFESVKSYLEALGIPYKLNPCLVRGLDYYCHTVFEWTTDALGAQGTVCAGGRYDGLVQQLGGKQLTPAIGFAMGEERLLLLLEALNKPLKIDNQVDAYVMVGSPECTASAIKLAEQLRTDAPHLKVLLHTGSGSLKNQFKKADKLGARIALVLGGDECKSGTVTVKYLREDKPQSLVKQLDVIGVL